MNIYDCRKKGDFNCCLLLRTEKKYNISDTYVDEYKDQNHHFIYGEYIVFNIIKEEQAAG